MTTTIPTRITNDTCKDILDLLYTTHETCRGLEGVEFTECKEAEASRLHEAAQCLGRLEQGCSPTTGKISEMVIKKTRLEAELKRLPSLEFEGYPVIDPVALGRIKEGIDRLFVTSAHSCNQDLFNRVADILCKKMEGSGHAMKQFVSTWSKFNSRDDDIVRYLQASGKMPEAYAAKLLIMLGESRETVMDLFLKS